MRAENSLLRSNHLYENVAGVRGEDESMMTFGDLVFGRESRLPSLANSLNVPSSEADSKVSLLNEIFRKVGVSCTDSMHFSLLIHRVTLVHSQIRYRVIPSRTSLLLIPTTTSL